MFIYIHIISYYKLFLYFNVCPSVMLVNAASICDNTPEAICRVLEEEEESPMFICIHIISYYKKM